MTGQNIQSRERTASDAAETLAATLAAAEATLAAAAAVDALFAAIVELFLLALLLCFAFGWTLETRETTEA